MWRQRVFPSLLALALCVALPSAAHAARCAVDNAKIVNVLQWDDGHIYIELDRAIPGCSCSINSRAAFHKDENQKFFIAAALTAQATNKSVYVGADDVGGTCPIHGNTPRLVALVVKPQ
jgi:hypothetical protein